MEQNKPATAIPKLDLIERRRIALNAEVDTRTLDRALAGLEVKPACMHRIRRALAAAGQLGLLPAPGVGQ